MTPKKIISIMAFPVVLMCGIVLIPVVTDYARHDLAAQAAQQSVRWFSGHILAAIAFGSGIMSVSTIEQILQARGKRLQAATLPLIAVGAGLYAAGLGADGIAPVALSSAGATPEMFFDGSSILVPAILTAGTVFFGIGLVFLVGSCIHAGVLKSAGRWLAMISVLVFMTAPIIPSGWGLYGVAAACFGVFAPLVVSLSQNQTDN